MPSRVAKKDLILRTLGFVGHWKEDECSAKASSASTKQSDEIAWVALKEELLRNIDAF
jgi:hypothetical protein